jgi:DNA-directed RNA polymerase sigma subunit (sigma70/sigma32)
MFDLQKLLEILDADDVISSEEDVIKIMHEAFKNTSSTSRLRTYQGRVDLMSLRYGLQGSAPHTLRSLSTKYALSVEAVRCAESHSIRKMKRIISNIRDNQYFKDSLQAIASS